MPRIVKLETFASEFVCFVKATTEDGHFGWGQTSTYNADITAQVFHRQLVPWVLGNDSEDIPRLIDLVQRREHKFPGSYRARALAGLDTALWAARRQARRDAFGRHARQAARLCEFDEARHLTRG
jgi:L-alanine-DL-glutamate epimerase-like enolase superfamily enzyme